MTRLFNLTASAALCAATAAAAQGPAVCSLLTPDQIKALLNTAVQPGVSGGTKDSPTCSWKDAKGEDRVYVALKDGADFRSTRSTMQTGSQVIAVTGVGEDAFLVASTGSSAALYTLKKRHMVLLTATGENFSKQQNEEAEKALALELLGKL
jgi:hypothetical protein